MFSCYERLSEKAPAILTLSPPAEDDRPGVTHQLELDSPVTMEKEIAALAAARLDYDALSAGAIFVGKNARVSKDGWGLNVTVDHVLYGKRPQAGKTVNVWAENLVRPWHPRPGPQIYFIGEMGYDEDLHRYIYVLNTCLPPDQPPAVLQALGRRSLYPVVEREEYGKRAKVREVVFRGAIDDAIEFMGSCHEPSLTLATRMLMSNKEAAKPRILAAIEQDLLAQSTPPETRFLRLENLIGLLRPIGEAKSDDAADCSGLPDDRQRCHL